LHPYFSELGRSQMNVEIHILPIFSAISQLLSPVASAGDGGRKLVSDHGEASDDMKTRWLLNRCKNLFFVDPDGQ